MVLTVEPGCYFIEPLLEEALGDPLLAPFIHKDTLLRSGQGGLRLFVRGIG